MDEQRTPADDMLAALNEATVALHLMLSYHGPLPGDFKTAAHVRAEDALDVIEAAIKKATGSAA